MTEIDNLFRELQENIEKDKRLSAVFDLSRRAGVSHFTLTCSHLDNDELEFYKQFFTGLKINIEEHQVNRSSLDRDKTCLQINVDSGLPSTKLISMLPLLLLLSQLTKKVKQVKPTLPQDCGVLGQSIIAVNNFKTIAIESTQIMLQKMFSDNACLPKTVTGMVKAFMPRMERFVNDDYFLDEKTAEKDKAEFQKQVEQAQASSEEGRLSKLMSPKTKRTITEAAAAVCSGFAVVFAVTASLGALPFLPFPLVYLTVVIGAVGLLVGCTLLSCYLTEWAADPAFNSQFLKQPSSTTEQIKAKESVDNIFSFYHQEKKTLETALKTGAIPTGSAPTYT